MPTWEIELRGFDPKEDAQDGATSRTVYFTNSEYDTRKALKECIESRPYSIDHVHWNPKLSKVIRCVEDCEQAGYSYSIRHEVSCKKCKRVFRGSTHKEAADKWAEHLIEC